MRTENECRIRKQEYREDIERLEKLPGDWKIAIDQNRMAIAVLEWVLRDFV